jgi:V/A-type H+-transporting ATPase subunit C
MRLMSDSGRVAPKTLLELYNDDRCSQLPRALGEAIVEAKNVLARTANPQLADFVLDRACFAEIREAAKALDCPYLSGYAAILTDSANLKSAVRTLRMGKDMEFMDFALIPGGSVDTDRIINAGDKEGISALFAHGLLEKAAALGAEAVEGGSMTAFELACDNAVNAYLQKAKLVSYGPEALVAYLAAVEGEITAVRMILTGRLAGIEPQVIRERLRDLYA